jgi:hypothetical protein
LSRPCRAENNWISGSLAGRPHHSIWMSRTGLHSGESASGNLPGFVPSRMPTCLWALNGASLVRTMNHEEARVVSQAAMFKSKALSKPIRSTLVQGVAAQVVIDLPHRLAIHRAVLQVALLGQHMNHRESGASAYNMKAGRYGGGYIWIYDCAEDATVIALQSWRGDNNSHHNLQAERSRQQRSRYDGCKRGVPAERALGRLNAIFGSLLHLHASLRKRCEPCSCVGKGGGPGNRSCSGHWGDSSGLWATRGRPQLSTISAAG